MKVVADSSPLIVLAKIHRLEILPKLFSSVYISEDVYSEVVVSGAGLPGASQVARAGWIEVRAMERPEELAAARSRFGIGLGELSTILLAKEIGAPVVLMDESRGRQIAIGEGLEPRGALGILEALFRRGDLPDLRDAFRQLLQSGAHLNRELLNRRLALFSLPPL